MPKENLSSYIENFTEEQMDHINQNLNFANNVEDGVVLTIPKFKFDYDLNLKKDLEKLGIKDAFIDGKADFSKMEGSTDPDKKLHVSEVFHKADIKFTEEGIKAAAVTVIIINIPGSAYNPNPRIPKPLYIPINKPFMFIIRDKETKDNWFTGTVYEPNKWEDEEEDYEPKYKNLFKLCFEYPHLSLAGYKYNTTIAIRSSRPCYGKGNQSLTHWIFEYSFFSLCRSLDELQLDTGEQRHLSEQPLKRSLGSTVPYKLWGLWKYLANTIPIISSSLANSSSPVNSHQYTFTSSTIPNTELIVSNSIFDGLSCGSVESLMDTTLSILKIFNW
ncbi:Serpin domain-containing protein [Neocallimastix sp. 'constans']